MKLSNNLNVDVIIVGTGVSGMYAALNLPSNLKILMLSKETVEESDSFLAQGGICVLKDDKDYDNYYQDTMRAGHFENNPQAVDIMISSSKETIRDLINFGVDFEKEKDGSLAFTREGAHSTPRILFHEDITGKEISSKLYEQVKKLSNVTLLEHTTMLDIIEDSKRCYGIIYKDANGDIKTATAPFTIWACGGIGGLFEHSTNFRQLTGDALAIALKHGIDLEHPDYIQIHPTTLYSTKKGRRFLISESVRGEGAKLINSKGERFTDELQPRDVVTAAIRAEMTKEGTSHVWLDMRPLGEEEIKTHFPNIYEKCLEEGYDCTVKPIPVVPAQHYFMGGVKVDMNSETSLSCLYAAGETSCNGVHGANRLASNSLLESLIFAKRAARHLQDREDDKKDYEAACQDGRLEKAFDAIVDSEYYDFNQLMSDYSYSLNSEIRRQRKLTEIRNKSQADKDDLLN